jgi:hypothetical protein
MEIKEKCYGCDGCFKKKTTQRLIAVNMGDGTVLLAHQVRIQNTRTGDLGTRYILLKMNCVRDHTA